MRIGTFPFFFVIVLGNDEVEVYGQITQVAALRQSRAIVV